MPEKGGQAHLYSHKKVRGLVPFKVVMITEANLKTRAAAVARA